MKPSGRELGFDQPLFVQYLRWLERVAHGDLGQSLRSKRPVLDIILERYPATIYLAVASLLLGILIAIPAGTMAAVKQNTGYDYGAMVFALFGISVPNFWFALLLILIFGIYLRWFPTIGYVAPVPTWRGLFNASPSRLLFSDTDSPRRRHVTSGRKCWSSCAWIMCGRRGPKDYLARLVLFKHVLKNSLTPAITIVGLHIGRLLGGSTVVETVFGWPGLAKLVLDAVYARDYPVLQGAVLLLALSYVIINLLIDLLYKWLNPRLRLG